MFLEVNVFLPCLKAMLKRIQKKLGFKMAYKPYTTLQREFCTFRYPLISVAKKYINKRRFITKGFIFQRSEIYFFKMNMEWMRWIFISWSKIWFRYLISCSYLFLFQLLIRLLEYSLPQMWLLYLAIQISVAWSAKEMSLQLVKKLP